MSFGFDKFEMGEMLIMHVHRAFYNKSEVPSSKWKWKTEKNSFGSLIDVLFQNYCKFSSVSL